MTAAERFDRDFADLLAELAEPQLPDYFDDVVGQAVAHRQRPAWTFPERWISMGVLTRRQPLFPAMTGRMASIFLMLLLLLAATAAIGVGALLLQQRPAPPFGPAANGVIAYSYEGDIYTRDPVTGQTRVVVGGPAADVEPEFSRDGTRLIWIRLISAEPREVAVMTARTDGSEMRVLVEREPAGGINRRSLSPAGDRLMLVNDSPSVPNLSVVDVATGVRSAIEVPVGVESLEWLPGGEQIVLLGVDDRDGGALYSMNVNGSEFRRLTDDIPHFERRHDIGLAVSHDGRLMSFHHRVGGLTFGLRMVDLETLEEWWVRQPTRLVEVRPVFSPDSRLIAFTRHDPSGPQGTIQQAYVGPIGGLSQDASQIGPVHAENKMLNIYFSPDSKSLLITSDAGEAWLVDLATSDYHELSWKRDDFGISWQRRAP